MTEVLLAMLARQALLFSAAILLLWALRPLLLKRLGATAAYAAWLLVPALLLTPAVPRLAQEPLHLVLQAAGAPAAPALPALPAPATDMAAAWLALWLAGAVLVVLARAHQQWQLARLGDVLPAGSSPALVGLLRPRIVLPADFEQRFPPIQRELILAHEEVHRKRLDNVWNLLACALTALHWWNPLAWWAARRFQADQELACDAAVLAPRPEALLAYTRALLAAHELTPHGAPVASRWGSTHPLVERIAMLNRPSPVTRGRALLLTALLGAISAFAYGAQEPAPLSAGWVQLQVVLERSNAGERERQEFRLVGKDGELMKVRLDRMMGEPFWIHLRPRKAGENVMIETLLKRGDPGAEIGHPNVLTAWGTKARIEIAYETSPEKFALELTPSAPPADFKPPVVGPVPLAPPGAQSGTR